MAADPSDRDDEAPRTAASEPDPSGSDGEGLTASGDEAPGLPEDATPAGPVGETREQPQLDDQAIDAGPAAASAETEIRPIPPDLSRPDRVGPGSTSVMPPVDDAPGSPRWSARAPVRTPDIAEDDPHDWAEPPRALAVPILVTVCILLLVVLLGLGSWLIFASRPSSTPATTPTVQNATPPATTAARTTTTAPTTPPPTLIPIPEVRGLTYETAAAVLTQVGFKTERRDEVDDEVPKGNVVRTEPEVGTPAMVGAQIAVVVSLGPPDASPSPTAEQSNAPD